MTLNSLTDCPSDKDFNENTLLNGEKFEKGKKIDNYVGAEIEISCEEGHNVKQEEFGQCGRYQGWGVEKLRSVYLSYAIECRMEI